MNISRGPPQNYFRGDRWSQNWCSDTKIPLFLDLSAPPVANGAGVPSIENEVLKLTPHLRMFVNRTFTKKSADGSYKKRISSLRLLLLDGDVFCEQFNVREMKVFGVQNDFY